ncbi:MAG: hypothetical protein ACQETJ_04510 [Bacteroidota bacterium]
MTKWLKHTTLVLFFSVHWGLMAQNPDATMQLETIMESILQDLEEETDAALILEDLEEYAENPLNVNAAGRSHLSRLHLLNDIQIEKLTDYLENYGPVYSIYELNSIDGFTPELLTKMEPFIWFGPAETEPVSFKESLKYGRHEFFLRTLGVTQKPRGYKERDDGTIPFEGNRARYYTRYRFRAGESIAAGFTAEKDPGEAFFSGANKQGFDFYSAHLSLKLSNMIENITVGDFVVRSGQGLVLWQGFSTGKTVYALDISKTNQGVRPFTSTDENRFFRGASATLNIAETRLNIFYSNKKNDANLAFSDSLGNYFTSLQASGYHRTKNETADKNSVRDVNLGVVATRQFNHLKIGLTFLRREFELPFIRSTQLYNQFRFKETNNYTGGVNYLFSKGKYQLFGEAALSKSKGKAFLQGAIGHLHDRIQFSALFRHLDKNYHALWANPFSESSMPGNETGLYFGTRILPVKFVTLTAYSDFYHSEWINFTTAGPANGWDLLAQADFHFSDRFTFYLRYKNEVKDQKFRENEKYINLPEQHRKSRIHFQFQPSEIIKLKTRAEHVFYKGTDKENGFMVFQDVQYSPVSVPLNLTARIAWFKTESYNSRIYAYENDLLYMFSIPAYFGKGFRTYLNMKYKISENIEAWFKLANTTLSNAESIGSGYSEISGNKKTEVKFQLRLKL